VSWWGPPIGGGQAIILVHLGPRVAAAAIDHFGLFGALKTTLTAKRALGLLVMAIGVYLAKKPR
jgi:transporter family-2 protein